MVNIVLEDEYKNYGSAKINLDLKPGDETLFSYQRKIYCF
jgi:hypothetical protein